MNVHVLETGVPPMLALLVLIVDVVLVIEYERPSRARSILGKLYLLVLNHKRVHEEEPGRVPTLGRYLPTCRYLGG